MASQARPLSPQQINLAELPVTNPAGIQSVYANNAMLFNAPHDIRLVFTEIILDAPNTGPRQEMRASVAISYSEAQLLHQALSQALAMAKTAPKV